MKKWIAALLALILLCSLGVTACADDAETLPGVYAMVDMKDPDSEEDAADQLATLAAVGMTPTLTIDENGHGVLEMVGETEEMQFDFAAGTVTVSEIVVPYDFDGTLLRFGSEGITFSFSNDPSALPQQKGNGTFCLYRLTELTDNEIEGNLAEDGEEVRLVLFDGGAAKLGTEDEMLAELRFDFDAMTVAEGDEVYPFELEGTTLRILGEGEERMVFEQIDPGYVGPYIVTEMSSGEEDLSEQLALLDMMGMRPTLEVTEDGTAVMVLFGVEMKLAFDFDAMTVVGYELTGKETEPMAFSYDFGVISFEQEDTLMSFSRVMNEG